MQGLCQAFLQSLRIGFKSYKRNFKKALIFLYAFVLSKSFNVSNATSSYTKCDFVGSCNQNTMFYTSRGWVNVFFQPSFRGGSLSFVLDGRAGSHVFYPCVFLSPAPPLPLLYVLTSPICWNPICVNEQSRKYGSKLRPEAAVIFESLYLFGQGNLIFIRKRANC